MGFLDRFSNPQPGPRRKATNRHATKSDFEAGVADRRSLVITGHLPAEVPMVSQQDRDAFRREAAPLNGLGQTD